MPVAAAVGVDDPDRRLPAVGESVDPTKRVDDA